MIAVTTEPYGDGWRWVLVDADGQRVLTGTQAYGEQAKAHQMGQLQLDAARQGHLPIDDYPNHQR